jgi:hypothetical protein
MGEFQNTALQHGLICHCCVSGSVSCVRLERTTLNLVTFSVYHFHYYIFLKKKICLTSSHEGAWGKGGIAPTHS